MIPWTTIVVNISLPYIGLSFYLYCGHRKGPKDKVYSAMDLPSCEEESDGASYISAEDCIC